MKDRLVKVLKNYEVADGIYEMVLQTADFPEEIVGGQFIHIALPDSLHLLRRPFCICDYDAAEKSVTVLYAVVGEGTEILTKVAVGSELKAMFPLGNGFNLEGVTKVALVGGGMGAAILPAIPKTWKEKEYFTFLGFASAGKAILVEEMNKAGEVFVATDDGSLGEKGFVTNLLASMLDSIKPDVILCCGPEVMYKALAKVLEGEDIPVYVSLERRMGCGVGACLVCNCKIKTSNGEKYLRACADGPVFNLKDVVL